MTVTGLTGNEMKRVLFDESLWAEATRTLKQCEALREDLGVMQSRLDATLLKHADSGDRDWIRRARALRIKVTARRGEINRRIKQFNREASVTAEALDRKWGDLCLDLALALARSDQAHELDQINVRDETTTAREWIELRLAQQMARRLKGAA